MKKMPPVGIKIIAIINFIITIWYLYTYFLHFRINYLIIALFFTIIGIYLWVGRKWAKFVELFICLIGIFIGFIFSLGGLLASNINVLPQNVTFSEIYLYLVFGILSLIIWIIIGTYLLTNKKAKDYLNN